MPFNKQVYYSNRDRKSGVDYTQPGIFFVTMTVAGLRNELGMVLDGEFYPNSIGEQAIAAWELLEQLYKHIRLGAYALMPNHFHAIIHMNDLGLEAAENPVRYKSLGRVIGVFKLSGEACINFWDNGFYDYRLRDSSELPFFENALSIHAKTWERDRFYRG